MIDPTIEIPAVYGNKADSQQCERRDHRAVVMA
jgi:hypothetical protein